MAVNGKRKTPLLDELEKGPWPSFVKEIKKATETSSMCDDLLGQLELSYQEKIGHWKHGGIVGVLGYGGGVIGRYSDVGEQFPNVAHFIPCALTSLPAGSIKAMLCVRYATFGSGTVPVSPICTVPLETSSSWGPQPMSWSRLSRN